jgi:excisionase family DNA binding protein
MGTIVIPDDLVKMSEAARLLNLSQTAIAQAVEIGTMPHTMIGGTAHISLESIDMYRRDHLRQRGRRKAVAGG